MEKRRCQQADPIDIDISGKLKLSLGLPPDEKVGTDNLASLDQNSRQKQQGNCDKSSPSRKVGDHTVVRSEIDHKNVFGWYLPLLPIVPVFRVSLTISFPSRVPFPGYLFRSSVVLV
jgi:hypothetical protein